MGASREIRDPDPNPSPASNLATKITKSPGTSAFISSSQTTKVKLFPGDKEKSLGDEALISELLPLSSEGFSVLGFIKGKRD